MELRDLASLGATALFQGTDVRDLGPYLPEPLVRVQTFPKGSLILLAGCAYEELKVLLEGRAEAEMAGGGRSTIVETFVAPEAVATAMLFSPEAVLPVNVLAVTEVRLISIPKAVLLKVAAALPPVLEALLNDMGSRLALLADKYRALSFETLRERLADWLLRRAGRRGPESGSLTVVLPESKERLSAGFGVARPSLSREFSWLEDHGLIRVRGREIDILDEVGLEALRAGKA